LIRCIKRKAAALFAIEEVKEEKKEKLHSNYARVQLQTHQIAELYLVKQQKLLISVSHIPLLSVGLLCLRRNLF
jgi:hypothetical protein